MRHSLFAMLPMLSMLSCATPGQHAAEQAVIRPSEVTDFRLLYAQNCSGCHGPNGQGALSVAIGGPVYLAIAADLNIRRVIEEGRAGTAMQAFSQRAGGFLTEAQIDVLIRGIRAWSRPGDLSNNWPPAYSASLTGDAARGQQVFVANCSSCHGTGGSGARVIADSSYLALVTDQHLRTAIIAGMPNLGMPDWRGHAAPLSEADVTDVVAWLAMHRTPLSASLGHLGGSE
jgi:cytochrome c oxidase cbb3-type subunit 3/ubiquinol-cytochrome c reductase cytochrome c subunit